MTAEQNLLPPPIPDQTAQPDTIRASELSHSLADALRGLRGVHITAVSVDESLAQLKEIRRVLAAIVRGENNGSEVPASTTLSHEPHEVVDVAPVRPVPVAPAPPVLPPPPVVPRPPVRPPDTSYIDRLAEEATARRNQPVIDTPIPPSQIPPPLPPPAAPDEQQRQVQQTTPEIAAAPAPTEHLFTYDPAAVDRTIRNLAIEKGIGTLTQDEMNRVLAKIEQVDGIDLENGDLETLVDVAIDEVVAEGDEPTIEPPTNPRQRISDAAVSSVVQGARGPSTDLTTHPDLAFLWEDDEDEPTSTNEPPIEVTTTRTAEVVEAPEDKNSVPALLQQPRSSFPPPPFLVDPRPARLPQPSRVTPMVAELPTSPVVVPVPEPPSVRALVAEEIKEKYNLHIDAMTVASDEHLDRNEDALFQLSEKRAVGVFDGMGGHAAGDKASQIARDSVSKSLSAIQEGLDLSEANSIVRQALIDANSAVHRQGQVEKNNMGTTASVVYVWHGQKGERKAIIGNVGDSRVYLFRGDKLEQITLDDNAWRSKTSNEQQARELQSKMSNVTDSQKQLTKSEQILFDARNQISQALGLERVEPRIHTVDLQTGDRIVVCSDGISDNLTDKEISAILKAYQGNVEGVQRLITTSQTRSRSSHDRAKPDDMTVAIMNETEVVVPPPAPQPKPAAQPTKPAEVAKAPPPHELRINPKAPLIDQIKTAFEQNYSQVNVALGSAELENLLPQIISQALQAEKVKRYVSGLTFNQDNLNLTFDNDQIKLEAEADLSTTKETPIVGKKNIPLKVSISLSMSPDGKLIVNTFDYSGRGMIAGGTVGLAKKGLPVVGIDIDKTVLSADIEAKLQELLTDQGIPIGQASFSFRNGKVQLAMHKAPNVQSFANS